MSASVGVGAPRAPSPGAGWLGTGTMRWSSSRLVMSYVLLFAVSTAVLLGITYAGTQRALQAETDALVNAEVDALLAEFRRGGRAQLVRTLDDAARVTSRSGAVYLLATATRQRVAGNVALWPSAPVARGGWIEFDAAATNDDRDAPEPVRARVQRLQGGDWLLVGTDLSEQQRALERFRDAWAWGVGFATLVAALLGVVYVRRVDQRVRRFAETCERILGGELERRLPLAGAHDEFDQLAGAVNHMLDRIEAQSRTVRTTFDSTAHDLRGPLHRVRMRLEEALRHDAPESQARVAIEDSLVDLERVQRTLATLLTIAQADARGSLAHADRIDLAALVRELVGLYAPEARARGLAMRGDAAQPAWVDGNRQLLAQLVMNLLENAGKYVPRGGSVVARVTPAAGEVVLEIDDDGPGIPAAERALVLQPFTRLARDHAESGSGLGLSLVAAVARLHGATLTLAERTPGLRVRVVLPASAPASTSMAAPSGTVVAMATSASTSASTSVTPPAGGR